MPPNFQRRSTLKSPENQESFLIHNALLGISESNSKLERKNIFTPFVPEAPHHILLYVVGRCTKGVVELTYE